MARYEAAIARKYPPQRYIAYRSVDSVLDAHPDFREAQKVFAEDRERLIQFLEAQKEASPTTEAERVSGRADSLDGL